MTDVAARTSTEPPAAPAASPAAAAGASQRRPDAQLAAGVALAWARALEPGDRRRIDFGPATDARYGEPDAPAGTPAGTVVAGPRSDDAAQGALLAMPSYGALTAPLPLPDHHVATRVRHLVALVATVVVSAGAGWALAHAAPPRAHAPTADLTIGTSVTPPPQRTPFIPRYPFGGSPR